MKIFRNLGNCILCLEKKNQTQEQKPNQNKPTKIKSNIRNEALTETKDFFLGGVGWMTIFVILTYQRCTRNACVASLNGCRFLKSKYNKKSLQSQNTKTYFSLLHPFPLKKLNWKLCIIFQVLVGCPQHVFLFSVLTSALTDLFSSFPLKAWNCMFQRMQFSRS